MYAWKSHKKFVAKRSGSKTTPNSNETSKTTPRSSDAPTNQSLLSATQDERRGRDRVLIPLGCFLIICDSNCEIFAVNSAHGGRTHDARLLRSSILFAHLEQKHKEGEIDLWLLVFLHFCICQTNKTVILLTLFYHFCWRRS